ncbi:Hypothetical Protein FCC1311_040482 [Hondaea fermentalgiana]|uniref:Uncharacterized protein n=1 Tax=Hondaea fermentalgiana TaxID=2315210 RepID=A0A2R5GB60_9STRA|nr:Hypothetical Protein FCC1311_040482 [Hondaea fermentalgiana]|eukprot:GBG27825.1 Hypothetical Protein FCC1311_040482 [Hondaea fermentalgiana]
MASSSHQLSMEIFPSGLDIAQEQMRLQLGGPRVDEDGFLQPDSSEDDCWRVAQTDMKNLTALTELDWACREKMHIIEATWYISSCDGERSITEQPLLPAPGDEERSVPTHVDATSWTVTEWYLYFVAEREPVVLDNDNQIVVDLAGVKFAANPLQANYAKYPRLREADVACLRGSFAEGSTLYVPAASAFSLKARTPSIALEFTFADEKGRSVLRELARVQLLHNRDKQLGGLMRFVTEPESTSFAGALMQEGKRNDGEASLLHFSAWQRQTRLQLLAGLAIPAQPKVELAQSGRRGLRVRVRVPSRLPQEFQDPGRYGLVSQHLENLPADLCLTISDVLEVMVMHSLDEESRPAEQAVPVWASAFSPRKFDVYGDARWANPRDASALVTKAMIMRAAREHQKDLGKVSRSTTEPLRGNNCSFLLYWLPANLYKVF